MRPMAARAVVIAMRAPSGAWRLRMHGDPFAGARTIPHVFIA